MTNHSDPMSTIDHDTLDDVTGACAPACGSARTPATPAVPPAQTGCHGALQRQQPQSLPQQFDVRMPQQFDVRSWMQNFIRRFRY